MKPHPSVVVIPILFPLFLIPAVFLLGGASVWVLWRAFLILQ